MNNDNMILIMIDECNDEVVIERFHLALDLDDDEIEIWQERKIIRAQERFPEAIGFYFEDRRNWNSMINSMLNDCTLAFDDF